MTEKEITLKDIHEDLQEMLKWMRFSGLKQVKSALESNLESDQEKMIYSLSNGKNSSYDIAKKINANDTVRRKISDYWKKWENAGLGTSSVPSKGGPRFKYSFDLGDFGIKSPELPNTVSKTIEEKSNGN